MFWYYFFKRSFDTFFSVLGLMVLWPVIISCIIIAALETRSKGIFIQRRIGLHGKPFNVYKIKTMIDVRSKSSGVTVASDNRITKSGLFMRRCKLDELPQLVNVLLGKMSFVGPRPDLPGFADRLNGSDRRLLSLLPGITSPASVFYKYEEEILDHVDDPIAYNRDVIWPHKVSMNLWYLDNWSPFLDLKVIFKTLL